MGLHEHSVIHARRKIRTKGRGAKLALGIEKGHFPFVITVPEFLGLLLVITI
jgi:hypothetical protein